MASQHGLRNWTSAFMQSFANLVSRASSPKEVREDMVATLGEGAPSHSLVKRAPWVKSP